MGSRSWIVEEMEEHRPERPDINEKPPEYPRLDALQNRVESSMSLCEEILESWQKGNDCMENEELEVDKLELAIARFMTEVTEVSRNGRVTDQVKVTECTNIQIRAEDLLLTLKRKCKSNKSKSDGQNLQTKATVTSRLPKLGMASFDGNHLKWYAFWDNFQSAIDSREDLTDASKLSYLEAYLEGEALEAIQNLEKTNTNYKVALDILTERFGKPDLIIEAHYDALSDITPAKDDTRECRKVLNQIEGHLRVLKSLGEDINHNMFRSTIKRKFPKEVKGELWLRLKAEGYTVANLRKALEEIISAKEEEMKQTNSDHTRRGHFTTETFVSAGPMKGKETRTSQFLGKKRSIQQVERESYTNPRRAGRQQPKHHFKHNSSKMPISRNSRWVRTNTATQLASKWTRDEPPVKRRRQEHPGANRKQEIKGCVFCQGSHYNEDCKKHTTLEERKRLLKGRCFICFRSSHQSFACPYKEISCIHCKKTGHNRCLCPERKQTTVAFSQSHGDTILQTAIIDALNEAHDHMIPARTLFDTGSQKSYVTQALADKLCLKTIEESCLTVYTFGQLEPKIVHSRLVYIHVNTSEDEFIEILAYVVPNITGLIPAFPEIKDKIRLSHPQLQLAPDSTVDSKADILIGNDHYHSLISGSCQQVAESLFMVQSKFGWIMSGSTQNCDELHELMVLTYVQGGIRRPSGHSFTFPDPPLQEDSIKDLWELETIGIKDSPKILNQDDIIKFFNETTILQDNRYQVKWPWIEYPTDLPVNYGMAFGRLSGLVKRTDMATLQQYDRVLQEQLEKEIIEVVKDSKLPNSHAVHYLPHHCVIQDNKTTKLRVVYDASAKSKGHCSLNEYLYKGPLMLEDLVSLLLRFRTTPIGITADIEKAYLQVGLQKEDRDVTRFLWLKDITKGVTEENIVHLRFCRVPFGVISSPYLLAATIKHHLVRKHAIETDKIAESLYVDNLVTGTESVDSGLRMYQASVEAFKELSMNLRDWTTNSTELREQIPTEHRSEQNHIASVLGLKWDTHKDVLRLAVDTSIFLGTVKTKREILRIIASVFDPCGFVAPLLLPSRILLQNLWIKKYKWDTQLEETELREWDRCIQPLKFIDGFEIPRYYEPCDLPKLKGKNEINFELHCFTDASQEAYSAVIYLRHVSGSNVSLNMIMSRTRLCPVKERERMTIPKLELLGVLIGTRLVTFVKQTLKIGISQAFLWSDSQIVLDWMKTEKLLPPFVSRRIAEIKSHPSIQFRYVNSYENPADIATRQQFGELPEFWLQGPPFLRLPEGNWPPRSNSWHGVTGVAFHDEATTQPSTQENQTSPSPVFDDEEPEEYDLKQLQIIPPGDHHINQDVADDHTPPSQLTTLKELQFEHFPKEAQGHSTHLTNTLGLFKDEQGLLRCKGRLQNALLPYDQKFPILIPKNTSFTEQLIQKLHEDNKHVGVSHTLSLLRKRYWVPQGRSQVVRALKKCAVCIKYGGGPYKLPPMPPLPAERVQLCRPFMYCGLDYLGPLTVVENSLTHKRWCCIFTCMASRAVRLEVIKNLSADEFLLCLRRFIASQGVPALVVSDNAAQFKLAAEVLQSPICKNNNIAWHFIPELSPWQGGFYERLVSLVKHCLRRSLDKTLLNDSQLVTVFKEIETVLNSRPLTTVGSELDHVLTPSDFLAACGTHPLAAPDETDFPGVTATGANLIEGWKKGQTVLEEFKAVFKDQYLTNLRERAITPHSQPRVLAHKEPKVGDIVQIWDERQKTSNRAHWKVGKIAALFYSRDGTVRTAQVKLDSGTTLNRSISHLYPLELHTEVSKEHGVVSNPEISSEPHDHHSPIQQHTSQSGPPPSTPAPADEITPSSAPTTPALPDPIPTSSRPQRNSAQAARKLIRHWTQSLISLSPKWSKCIIP